MNFSSKSTRSWSSNGATDNLDCRNLSKDCTEIQSPPPSKSLQRHHQPPESGLMKEDDMSSWFYYLLDDPFFDRDLPGVPDPPPPPDGRVLPKPADFSPALQSNQHYSYNQSTPQSVNFSNFAPSRSRFPESGSSATSRNNGLRESESWLSPVVSGGGTLAAGVGGCCTTLSNESDTCELILTSLSGDTASEDPVSRSTAGDRKRKGKELANDAISEYHSEDVKIESSESKKESSAQGSAKRSRAAEIRNLSVRRRRNRINEKMRALQELVPRCGKTDKASMLDEAIEYFKSLQWQVQMMSMGCGMVPMMVLGVQQYMSPMGMGVSTEMGMNHSAAPMSAALAGSALPTHGAPSMVVPKFPLQSFPMPNIPAPDSSTIQPSNLVDSFVNPQAESAPGMAKFPASVDPYLQYFSGLQMPLQMPQDQPNLMSSARKQRTRRESENSKTQQCMNLSMA